MIGRQRHILWRDRPDGLSSGSILITYVEDCNAPELHKSQRSKPMPETWKVFAFRGWTFFGPAFFAVWFYCIKKTFEDCETDLLVSVIAL